MHFFKSLTNINFLKNKSRIISASSIVILIGMASLLIHGGLRLGVDFTGGTILQVRFNSPLQTKEIRQSLKDIKLGKSNIQEYGSSSDFLIRMENSESKLEDIGSMVKEKLEKSFSKNQVTIERVESVGPKVGDDLRQKALFAMYYAILFITVYISGRFELKWMISIIMAIGLIGVMQAALSIAPNMSMGILIFAALIITLSFCFYLKLKYALAAIIALIHDVLITVTAFSLLNKEFTLPVIAALLTIIGYSLNDTIVVFDRIRENMKSSRRLSLEEIINKSINQSLSRTILTSLTTLLMVATLFFLGGEVIHNFSFALLIGVVVGTYSSIFIASPILLYWNTEKVSHSLNKA